MRGEDPLARFLPGQPLPSGFAAWCARTAATSRSLSAATTAGATRRSPATATAPRAEPIDHRSGGARWRDRRGRPATFAAARCRPRPPRTAGPPARALRSGRFDPRKPDKSSGRADRASRRLRIEHHAAADRHRRGVGTQDEPVAAGEHDGPFETDPGERGCASRDLGRLARAAADRGHRDAAEQLGGALVKPHAAPCFSRTSPPSRSTWHRTARRLERAADREGVPASEVGDLDASEIHCRHAGRRPRVRRPPVHLEAANLDCEAAREHDGIPARAPACPRRACR
jgi:hypothetical protein